VTARTVIERGRAKAYRPLPDADRRAAFAAGLAAYDRGDWFLAHELLEPAWMGTDDPVERTLDSGLIKLAAAGVHATRGNPGGVRKNLVGARLRLASLVGPGSERALARLQSDRRSLAAEIDLPALVASIDARLAAEAGRPTDADPPRIPRRS
jgi:hypothetical protein